MIKCSSVYVACLPTSNCADAIVESLGTGALSSPAVLDDWGDRSLDVVDVLVVSAFGVEVAATIGVWMSTLSE